MTKDKKILITGAAGFVGANLIRNLINNYNIHALVKKESNLWRLSDIKKDINLNYTSLQNLPKLKETLRTISPDYIIHLAAYGAYPFQQEFTQMVKTNVLGTYNLLEASKSTDYKQFINTGSSSEYGFKNKPMQETDVLDPNSFYAITKASSTQLCKVFAIHNSKPIITLRLFSVYGPYEENTRLIPTAIKAAINKKPLPLTKENFNRDFIYIEDVVEAYKCAMRAKFSQPEIYNIGTGKQYTNLDVATIIKKTSPNGLEIIMGEFAPRAWDIKFWVANKEKAKSALKWSPKNSLSEGLTKTFIWFSKNLSKFHEYNV